MALDHVAGAPPVLGQSLRAGRSIGQRPPTSVQAEEIGLRQLSKPGTDPSRIGYHPTPYR